MPAPHIAVPAGVSPLHVEAASFGGGAASSPAPAAPPTAGAPAEPPEPPAPVEVVARPAPAEPPEPPAPVDVVARPAPADPSEPDVEAVVPVVELDEHPAAVKAIAIAKTMSSTLTMAPRYHAPESRAVDDDQ